MILAITLKYFFSDAQIVNVYNAETPIENAIVKRMNFNIAYSKTHQKIMKLKNPLN